MTRAEIFDDIAATIALWRRRRLPARDAWFALTGDRRRHANWGQVEEYMIGWFTSRPRLAEVAPLRRRA